MSHNNQSMSERSDSSQYRKSGRSGGSAQPRNFSGGGRKGGGTAPPPASSSLASNWRLKKSNNAQGGESRVTIAQAVLKAPSSRPAAVSSDTTAPPNLDEQKHHQPRHDSSRAVPTFLIPSVPKQQIPRKDGGAGDQSNTGVANQMSKPKREVQISSAPALTQTQTPSVHPVPGVSMPMPFHQPQVPVQFGGPNTHIQSQGITATSSLPMPFPMGNSPQLQQQVFVPIMQPHPMQPWGIMHQGQNMNFTPQMGSQLPPQLGNLGVSMGSQFAQQQARKYGSSRKPVKITHPDTHEELRLDGGLSGPMQPQRIRHQGQNMNFTPQMGPQLPPQLGNLKVSMGSQFAQQSDLEEAVVHCKKDDTVADNLVISLPAATNSNTSSSSPKSSTRSNGDNEASTDRLGGKEAVVTKSVLSDEATIPVSTSSISEPALKHVGEGSEDNTGLVSHTAAGSKDKPIPELNRTKSTAVRGKKKRKEILQKADAARTTSDLYMACKGPEGKKGTVDSSQSMVSTSNINFKQVPIEAHDDIVSSEKGGYSKAEPDDWEDADISTLKLETVGDGKKVHGELKHLGVMTKKYSRDFLLKFSKQCIDLPEGIEIASDRANLMVCNVNVSREPHPSPGRSIERAKRKCASKRSKVKEQKGNVHQNGPPT